MNIVHTYRGDMIVHLVAPGRHRYLLHNRAGAGTWNLRVQDAEANDTG